MRKGFISFIIILSLVVITIVIGASGSYFLWYLPKVHTQQYVEKSRPIFEQSRDQLRVTKENAFLDIRTQRSSIQEAADDTDKDIEEIENNLSTLSDAKEKLASIKKTKSIKDLDKPLTEYIDTTENALQGLLAHQKFQKKMIEAFGFTLDSEIQNYTRASYAGGQRPDFIVQTQKIADLTNDALSRINILEVPPDDEKYYALKKENLEDIKSTFQNLNEFYRLGQDDLVTNEVSGITQRVERNNQEIKQNSQNFVDSSKVASDFNKLEDLESKITALYSSYKR